MNPLWKKQLYILAFSAILIAVSSVAVYAQTPPVCPAGEICNPIQARSFSQLIQTLASNIRIIAIPLAVVSILITGFKFVIAAAKGDEAGLKKAKSTLGWVVAGSAI